MLDGVTEFEGSLRSNTGQARAQVLPDCACASEAARNYYYHCVASCCIPTMIMESAIQDTKACVPAGIA